MNIEKFSEAEALLKKTVYYIIPSTNNIGKGVITKISFDVESELKTSKDNKVCAHVTKGNDFSSGYVLLLSEVENSAEEIAETLKKKVILQTKSLS